MWTYQPAVADMLHVLTLVLDAPASWAAQPGVAELDADTAREVQEQAGRFASDALAPTNAPGNGHGCRRTPEGVTTPPGFREALRAFVDGGWGTLACTPEAGGQGLSQLLNIASFEMLAAANHTWTMYPGLLHGAHEVVLHHAAPELRERHLPRLVSGEWLESANFGLQGLPPQAQVHWRRALQRNAALPFLTA
jgi:alkylation response protein AidB-like acyl-CoA dehydrogenase